MTLSEKIKNTIRNVPDFPKPGILFKDITPVLRTPALVHEITESLAVYYKPLQAQAVVGIESRGFIFGSLLAHQLQLPFVPVRKAGKLPFHSLKESYALEYGQATVEIHTDALSPGQRVIIHDDLLATGGTAAAAGRLTNKLGAKVVAFSFLVNLSFLRGEQEVEKEFGLKPHSLVRY